MGRYLLDSNAFIYFKSRPAKLRQETYETIQNPQNTLFVSAVGLWELADKASKGKLPEFAAIMNRLPTPLEFTLEESSFQLLSLELAHVASAYRLPLHHRDPFDRLMIAQAMVEDLTIISSDAIFRHYAGLKLLHA
jgi:PIN domain nuclease of toxin-antitoxin system